MWTAFSLVFFHLIKVLMEPSAMSIGDGANFFQEKIIKGKEKHEVSLTKYDEISACTISL
jgi:hypothetical protein